MTALPLAPSVASMHAHGAVPYSHKHHSQRSSPFHGCWVCQAPSSPSHGHHTWCAPPDPNQGGCICLCSIHCSCTCPQRHPGSSHSCCAHHAHVRALHVLRYPRLYIYPISISILNLISSYFHLDIHSQSTVIIQ